MAQHQDRDTGPSEIWRLPGNINVQRDLSTYAPDNLGAFSPAQSRAILVVGVTSASLSLFAALLALRWFLLMRRSFRHRLILFLILSDAFKSIWYFVFPIVVFTRGKVDSSSNFCQTTGFLLSFGLEASDYAILIIALHAVLHIFQPLRNIGDRGGIFPYRHWIYAFWVALPALAASLAFVNPNSAYVTSGTFCYLPKRPYWYRLALSWIPRYVIFIAILFMYLAIYFYVRIKFKGFRNLGTSDSRYGSSSESRRTSKLDHIDRENCRTAAEPFNSIRWSKTLQSGRSQTTSSVLGRQASTPQKAPWEKVSFITSKPLQPTEPTESHGITSEDFAPESSSPSADTRIPTANVALESEENAIKHESRKPSEVPTLATNFTGETAITEMSYQATAAARPTGTTDQLNMARVAIRRQLRILFVYPAVYLLMWTFPFASHCLLYSNYYVIHPPFWLSIVSTAMLSLQAGVDCIVFSWAEKPWRRVDKNSPLSMHSMHSFVLRKLSCSSAQDTSATQDSTVEAAIEEQGPKRDSNWWEAEGLKRKDSVWLGTDTMNQIVNQQEAEEQRSSGGEEK